MNESERQIMSILGEAVEYRTPAERGAFLDKACAGDAERRGRLEALLRAYEAAGNFMQGERSACALQATIDQAGVETPSTMFGPYKLLQQIGEGGMGTVFMAQQTEPVKRLVALKIIKAGMDSDAVLARFEAERQALAMMDHPNIAKVFDGGATANGRPYFVMELVKGTPITKYCDEQRLSPKDRLELIVQVCQAVQHAHQKGVIHRDLKPSNVLVAPYDGKPVVKVIDFGVAKAAGQPLTEKTLVTGFGAIVGTLEYMSPEQAELNNADIDTRSDLYALGVVLYELLTGTTPLESKRFKQSGVLEALRIIREEEPPTLSDRLASTEELPAIAANRGTEPAKLAKLVRGELDWIVMKCLEKDRNRRYETANAFAADVQNYLDDKPVLAVPPSAGYRLRKFARRNRREVLMAGAAAAVAMVGVAGLGVSRAMIARLLKSETRAKEEQQLEVYFQRITVAHRELSIGNVAAALRALGECPEDLHGWEWHYLMRLCKVEPLVVQDTTEVYGVAFSPDGERIASAGKDGKVKIWDSRTGRPVRGGVPAHATAACSVTFHPDGRHLASAGADRLVKVWDLATRREVFRRPCDASRKFGAAYTVAFRPPHGRQLAAGCDGEVTIWDWKNDKPLHTLSGHEHSSIPVAFSPNGGQLATGSAWRQGLSLWDAESGIQLLTWSAHSHPVSALAFSPNGDKLATASLDRSVKLWKLWDRMTAELLQTLPHTGNVLGVTFNPDGGRLASTGDDKTVHIWDPTTGREVLGLHEHTDNIGCVTFSPDGQRLASASHDGTIRVWDATPLLGDEGQEVFTFRGHDDEIKTLAVSPDPDDQRIVSAGGGGTLGGGTIVKVWNAATGQPLLEFPGHRVIVWSAAWHPDGRRVATAGSDGRQHAVKVWDASSGRVYVEISVGRDSSAEPYQAVAFSPPDGRYLVTGKLEGTVQVWDAGTGQKVGTLDTHDREIRAVVFSRDGRHLASASGDGKVKLWDATQLGKKHLDEKQTPLHTLQARIPGPGVNVAFSPDGKWLVTGGEGNTVKIWDAEKGGESLTTLKGHLGEVYAITVSGDETRWWIASGGEDSLVKIWDGRTGKIVRTFRGHTGLVSSLAFSPDGKRLYSGSRDKFVKVWDVSKLKDKPNR